MRTLFLFLFCAVAVSTQAQETQKIGYADWQYIFTQMPEMKQIEAELKTHGTQLENQLKAKSQEFEAKLKAYQSMPATTPDAIKADKERELQVLQESAQKFQQDAQTSLANKQNALMDPVFKKVGKAIEDVAKENGYSFIINPQSMNSGEDILLYSDEKYNISDLVLKKLGITPKPVAENK
ncbi:MAG: OmpH family outer membrane protein [Cyclobacteriaceae bacterium]|jgi:outer membrane protein|nr:OmpH family outer membrane protein [Cyclobacteriaceae bacterium]